MVTNANWPRLKTNWSKTQIDLQHFYVTCTVFNKVLSRWQKLLSRQKRKKLAPQAWLGSAESESYCGLGLGLLKCIFSILKQKLECLNRTQTLLNFGFLGSFFPKKSRRPQFTWNSWWISPAAGPYWKPCIGAILMAKNSLKINAPFRLPKIKLLESLSDGNSNEQRKSSRFRLAKQ